VLGLELPAGARPGDPLRAEISGREHLLLIEAADVAAWDLGTPREDAVAPLLSRRVEAALQRRTALVSSGTNILRAVNDTADGLPGVVIDLFADVALCQLYGEAYVPHADALVQPLRTRGLSVRLVTRRRDGARAAGVDRWYGPRAAGCCVLEAGLRYWVRFDREVLGTGLFPDQRAQRRRVRTLARGRRVLNLFAYAGGFTVAAAAGGAAAVDHVDLSKACLPWAARNLTLNGVDPRRHRFIAEDARDFVARAARGGLRYGMLVVDPPTFAAGRAPFRIERDLAPLLRQVAPLLDDDGLALVCANARGLEQRRFVAEAQAALGSAGRRALLVAEGEQGLDHPVPALDSPLRHLKAAWFQVVGD